MAKPVTIGSLSFRTLDTAKGYLRDKMYSYVIGQRIPDADASLWFSVLQKHEWFDEYVDFGIDHFACEMHERYRDKRNMVVVNQDGAKHPFSFQKYLTGEPLTKLQKVKRALRYEIEEQITDFRAGRKGGNVHHASKSFAQIADEWLTANATRWHVIETEAAGVTGYRLQDRALAATWQAHHQRHAVLEMLTAKENMSLGSGGYQPRFVPPPTLGPPPY